MWLLIPLFSLFGVVDLSFLGANLLKIAEGGWFPIIVGALVFAVMRTWLRGRQLIADQRARDALPLALFLQDRNQQSPVRVPGTAVFMTRDLMQVPITLLHAVKHYKVLHRRVIVLQVVTEDVPHVSDERRLEIDERGKGFYTMLVHYGFMDEPNVMRALAQCRLEHFHINLMETSFFIGREKIRLKLHHPMFKRWQRQVFSFLTWPDRLFIFLNSFALDATEFFRIPPNRVIELGGQIEI
jgi:KUP system potassium uptake protein